MPVESTCPRCLVCGQREASLYCRNDGAYLCGGCSDACHGGLPLRHCLVPAAVAVEEGIVASAKPCAELQPPAPAPAAHSACGESSPPQMAGRAAGEAAPAEAVAAVPCQRPPESVACVPDLACDFGVVPTGGPSDSESPPVQAAPAAWQSCPAPALQQPVPPAAALGKEVGPGGFDPEAAWMDRLDVGWDDLLAEIVDGVAPAAPAATPAPADDAGVVPECGSPLRPLPTPFAVPQPEAAPQLHQHQHQHQQHQPPYLHQDQQQLAAMQRQQEQQQWLLHQERTMRPVHHPQACQTQVQAQPDFLVPTLTAAPAAIVPSMPAALQQPQAPQAYMCPQQPMQPHVLYMHPQQHAGQPQPQQPVVLQMVPGCLQPAAVYCVAPEAYQQYHHHHQQQQQQQQQHAYMLAVQQQHHHHQQHPHNSQALQHMYMGPHAYYHMPMQQHAAMQYSAVGAPMAAQLVPHTVQTQLHAAPTVPDADGDSAWEGSDDASDEEWRAECGGHGGGAWLGLEAVYEGLTRGQRVARYKAKRARRQFKKTVRYVSRKAYAEARPRMKGRFVKKGEPATGGGAPAAEAPTGKAAETVTPGPPLSKASADVAAEAAAWDAAAPPLMPVI